MDIIPHLNTTPEGNTHILLIVDNYSRYGFASLMKSKSEKSIIQALTNYFLVMGVPAHIYSDSETSFVSAAKSLMEYFGFVYQTSPADSQFKNRAENCFRDLKSIITRVLSDPQRQLTSSDWDIALVYALNIFNTSPLSDRTFLTRELIHYNQEIKTTPLVYCDTPVLNFSDIDDILKQQESKRIKLYQHQDSKLAKPIFNPGDIVYARAQPAPGIKSTFAVNTRGPYQILTVNNDTKIVTARTATSKQIHHIAFERINKIAMENVTLDVFRNFLQQPQTQKYNMRPRAEPPDHPLRESMTRAKSSPSVTGPVTRSQSKF